MLTDKEIIEAYSVHGSLSKAAKALGMIKETYRLKLKRARARLGITNEEYITQLAHDKQRLQDINRVERKTWRGQARFNNALLDVDKTLIELIKTHNQPTTPSIVMEKNNKAFGVIQLSDLHLNECVDNDFGKYNWEIAAKRLRKHILNSSKLFITNNVTDVIIVMTGDMFNSNRRLDEILLNATNRANALFLGYSIIKEAIHELLALEFNVSITYVSGNESRIEENMSNTNILASDNFDSMLYHMLRYNLQDKVKFYTPKNCLENVISINGTNILLLHGHTLNGKLDTDVAKLFNKYTNIGVKLNYVMFGHLHNCLISDLYARSSSLVGNNDYSAYGLNLYGRSSQNCYIVCNGAVNGYRNDLEETSDVIGYQYDSELEAYHSTAKDKLHKDITVVQIVI